MKLQYKLVDIETKKEINIEEPFEVVSWCENLFNTSNISWNEVLILFGDPSSKQPIGIIKS